MWCMCQVWYLIVSIPDHCLLPYFVKAYFGVDLVLLSSSRLANVLVFKSMVQRLLDLIYDQEDDDMIHLYPTLLRR